MTSLTEQDRAILEHEVAWANRPHQGLREASARERLGLRPIPYYQRLNALLDHPAAAAEYPALVGRLRRIRETRRRR